MLGHTHSNTHVFVVMRPKSQSIMRAMRMYTVCGTVHAQWTILNHFVHKSAILKSMRTCIESIFVCFFPRLAPVCTVTTVSNRLFFPFWHMCSWINKTSWDEKFHIPYSLHVSLCKHTWKNRQMAVNTQRQKWQPRHNQQIPLDSCVHSFTRIHCKCKRRWRKEKNKD